MKIFRLELDFKGVALIRASDEARAAEMAHKRFFGQLQHLSDSSPEVFVGDIASSDRPDVSLSPIVTCIKIDTFPTLAHQD